MVADSITKESPDTMYSVGRQTMFFVRTVIIWEFRQIIRVNLAIYWGTYLRPNLGILCQLPPSLAYTCTLHARDFPYRSGNYQLPVATKWLINIKNGLNTKPINRSFHKWSFATEDYEIPANRQISGKLLCSLRHDYNTFLHYMCLESNKYWYGIYIVMLMSVLS